MASPNINTVSWWEFSDDKAAIYIAAIAVMIIAVTTKAIFPLEFFPSNSSNTINTIISFIHLSFITNLIYKRKTFFMRKIIVSLLV